MLADAGKPRCGRRAAWGGGCEAGRRRTRRTAAALRDHLVAPRRPVRSWIPCSGEAVGALRGSGRSCRSRQRPVAGGEAPRRARERLRAREGGPRARRAVAPLGLLGGCLGRSNSPKIRRELDARHLCARGGRRQVRSRTSSLERMVGSALKGEDRAAATESGGTSFVFEPEKLHLASRLSRRHAWRWRQEPGLELGLEAVPRPVSGRDIVGGPRESWGGEIRRQPKDCPRARTRHRGHRASTGTWTRSASAQWGRMDSTRWLSR